MHPKAQHCPYCGAPTTAAGELTKANGSQQVAVDARDPEPGVTKPIDVDPT
jgi:hypothetical protein